jgi:fructokinase
MKYVIGLGEALFDCLPTGRKLGGAPANFAYHVSQFGFQSYAISAIGNDELGQEIIDTFEQVGLHYCLPKVDYPTGTVQVTLDEKGIPQYEICLGVAWDNIPLTDELLAIAKDAKAVCFGSLAQRAEVSRATIQAMLEAMPKETLKVFDINLRQSWYSREVIEKSLEYSNILKINDEELDIVAPMLLSVETDPKNLIATNEEKTLCVCRQLIERYALDMVILTCGTNGSYVITLDTFSFIPTPKVEVADTVGAGDSFTATFIAKLLAGATIQEAHEMAVKVSAYVCTQSGAMPVLPKEFVD